MPEKNHDDHNKGKKPKDHGTGPEPPGFMGRHNFREIPRAGIVNIPVDKTDSLQPNLSYFRNCLNNHRFLTPVLWVSTVHDMLNLRIAPARPDSGSEATGSP